VLAVLASALLAVPAAHAVRSEFYGIAQPQGLDSGDRFGMALSKVRTDRFPLAWNQIEPSNGSFDWSQEDLFIGGLASVGIRPVPFVWGSPGWAGTGGVQRPPLSTSARANWQDFLKRAVGRYGPGGSYWGTPYHQQFGSEATPWPITTWQIWNEPNLTAFSPGSTYKQKAQKYGQLVQSSRDAIKSKDSKAQIALAGIASQNDPNAFNFLSSFYGVRHIKDKFDVAAVHPYASTDAKIKTAIQKFRAVMSNNGDKATPLWITEFAWGSGPPDSIGINKGLSGQATALTNSYKMLLANRTAWNLQRVFWFLWRDPESATGCSFCGTAGLVTYERDAKPALNAFRAFTTDSTKPQATITGGPAAGSTTHDKTPTFSFKSNEAGSTFQCRFDAKAFAVCSSPHTAKPLTNGSHKFYVKAIDAAGNESNVTSRSFRVG
jgi:hypothetical protein